MRARVVSSQEIAEAGGILSPRHYLPKPKSPKRYGLLLKVTEWKELRRRVEIACQRRNGGEIPDKPDWPPGSEGANLQKLRRLVQQLNLRFEKRE